MKTPLLRRVAAGLVLALLAAPVLASDLTVDGAANDVTPVGSSLVLSITGTPGAPVYLLVDVDPGPTQVFGQSLPFGFSPVFLLLSVGPMPGGGVLDIPLTIPADDELSGLTLYFLAAVADGPGPSSYDYSNGSAVTFVTRDMQLAGNPLSAYPFFETVRAFNAGTPTSLAIDPSRFPGIVGRTADLYLVASRDAAGWDADDTLLDVTGDGPDTVTFAGADIQGNTYELDAGTLSADAGAGLGVGYDVVVDFDQDGVLDDDDLIDGYGDESGMYAVHDTTQPGPLAVTEVTYSGGSFLAQNLFYPTDIASMGALPLVVVSHGNGHNYQWYDHIGDHLASYGFIVMSHQNNTQPGIFAASTTTLTNTEYFLGNLDIIEGGLLEGHVDSSRMTWIGHSRGGEGVVRAYDRIFEGTFTPVNFALGDVRLISSMAPTDFLGPGPSSPNAVDYHLWVGGADGDVTGCADNNIAQSFHLHDRAEQKRMSTSLHGVGHGDFHNSTGSVATGPCKVGKPDTHLIQLSYLLALVMHHIEGNVPAEDFLWRPWESFRPIGAPDGNPCVVVDLQYREGDASGKFVIDDFQTNPELTLSSSGGAVLATVQGLAEGRMDDENNNFTDNGQVWNGFTAGRASDTTAGIVFEFDGSGTMGLAFDIPPAGADARGQTYLSFRCCQATRDGFTQAEDGSLTFEVTLGDAFGNSSTIDIGAWPGGGIQEPYDRGSCGSGFGWANEFETVRIRLTDFQHDGSGLDLANLARVSFTFGPGAGSAQGRLGLDDVELTSD